MAKKIELKPNEPENETDTATDSDADPQQGPVAPERVYGKTRTIDHDLFKLEVAKMKKNMAWSNDVVPEYVSIEHCHFFHTVDSDGRPQTLSTPIGGHFHEMEIVKDAAGGIPKVVCKSGPMHFVRRKVKGRWVRVAEPVNDEDFHTHETTYLKSDRIEIRKTNLEATKVVTADALKTAPIAGVIS